MRKIRLQGYVEKHTDWGTTYSIYLEEPDGDRQHRKELVTRTALQNETQCKKAICECMNAKHTDVEIEIPSYIRFHDRRKQDAGQG